MIGAWDYYPVSDFGQEDGLDDHYADLESFETHYADEIEGRAEYPSDLPSEPVEMPALQNAPGQLQLFGGGLLSP